MRDRAHAAEHVSVKSLGVALAATQQMKKKSERGTGIVRAAMFAVHIVGEKHRLDFFGFVMAIEKIAEAAGEKGYELADLGAGHSPKAIPNAQKFEPAFDAVKGGIG